MPHESLHFEDDGIYDQFFEEYGYLSPTDRNSELLRLFRQLPYSIVHEDAFEEVTLESANLHAQEYARRRESELRNILAGRVAALLAHTNTTSQLRLTIIDQFRAWYDHGVVHEEMLFAELPRMIFADFQDDEGIFNNEHAKEIERKIYLSQMKSKLSILEILQETTGDIEYDIESHEELAFL